MRQRRAGLRGPVPDRGVGSVPIELRDHRAGQVVRSRLRCGLPSLPGGMRDPRRSARAPQVLRPGVQARRTSVPRIAGHADLTQLAVTFEKPAAQAVRGTHGVGGGDLDEQVVDVGGPEREFPGGGDDGGDIAELAVVVLTGLDQELEALLCGEPVGGHQDADGGADRSVAVQARRGPGGRGASASSMAPSRT